uniref:Uncharacterized protein n=1 Tax=Opuntia streptacantha TaxID=393608 RepID=A0A7C8ZPG2_OPUST
MPFSPVVPGPRLAENEVIRAKDLTIGPRSKAVHGSRLKIHENSTRNKPTTTSFVVVDIDSLQLKVTVTLIPPGLIDAMLGAHNFPELGTNLVPTLTPLYVKNFTHFGAKKIQFTEVCVCERERETEREREYGI